MDTTRGLVLTSDGAIVEWHTKQNAAEVKEQEAIRRMHGGWRVHGSPAWASSSSSRAYAPCAYGGKWRVGVQCRVCTQKTVGGRSSFRETPTFCSSSAASLIAFLVNFN